MIKIQNKTIKKQNNFWNQCVFHPTDAIEDPWGKRILDQMAADGAINTVRIYTMFEDIVYTDAEGKLCYDFRVSDLRLDYMLEKGYSLLLSYAGIPDCIASSTANKTSVSKNKTRYKGKMWNSAPPKDYSLWEEICYEYTKHNVERYGIETVSKWNCQCFNESDINFFFMSELPNDAIKARLAAYCKLYEAFQRGIRRVSEEIPVGGPALAVHYEFLDGFLDYVEEHALKLNFVSEHHYSSSPYDLREKIKPISVSNMIKHHQNIVEIVRNHGFANLPILMDEWGMASNGFCNKEECPDLMIRETEAFSAYFVKLIRAFLDCGCPPESLMICLSGQHEMVEDFSGFRNFFTLNFIQKPIYNAYILASKLGENLLTAETDSEDVSVIPTKDEKGNYAVLFSYANDCCDDTLPEREETIVFADDISNKSITVFCIDESNTNPYRLYEKMGIDTPTEEELKLLRQEGYLKPIKIQNSSEQLNLKLTANATYLITVTDPKE